MDQWYCVHTKPHRESAAEEHLKRQGFHVYLPRIRQQRRRQGRWSEAIEPLFPRYLFIRLDVDRQNAALIRSTRGVVGLVRLGEKSPPVPNAIVEAIRLGEQTRLNDTGLPTFDPGQPVQVIDGPLEGVQAIFLAVSGSERVSLLFELMGRTNKVLIPRRHVAAL